MLKIIKRFIASSFKKAASFFYRAVKAPGRFVIEFEFYDSDFRHVLVEYYDAPAKRFVKCALIGAKNTFKWRRHFTAGGLSGGLSSAGPELIIKLTRPALQGAQPFVVSRICLKAAGAGDSDRDATEVSRFEPSGSCVNMGFHGPYVYSSRTVLSLNGGGGSAYLVFGGVHEGLRAAGFDFLAAQEGAAVSMIELFTSGASGAVEDGPRAGEEKRAEIKENIEKRPEPERAPEPETPKPPETAVTGAKSPELKGREKTSGELDAAKVQKNALSRPEPASAIESGHESAFAEVAGPGTAAAGEIKTEKAGAVEIKKEKNAAEEIKDETAAVETGNAYPRERVAKKAVEAPPVHPPAATQKPLETSAVKINAVSGAAAESKKREKKPAGEKPEDETAAGPKKTRGSSHASKTNKDEPAGHFLIRFFSGDPWVEMIERLNPKFVKAIVARADGILAGEYEHNGVYFKTGEDVDWHADFNYSKWPARESCRNMASAFYLALENGPAAGEGVWPSSVQFAKNNEWVYLALAHRIKGADRYAQKIISLFKSFNASNEAGFGVNFASDAACAERLVSWLLAFELIEGACGAAFNMVGFHDIFSRHFDHIYERVVNRPNEAHRHERIISLACIYGILLQVGGRIAPAVTKVFKKLKEEIAQQFNADGGHASGSAAYQLAVYKALLYAVVLSKKSSDGQTAFAPNSLYEDAEFMQAFERMSRFLAAMAAPSGELPCVGDHYFYFYLPFDESSPLDVRPSLQMASFLLMNGEIKYLTGENKIAEIAMAFGEEGVYAYNGLRVAVPEEASSLFRETGYFTHRSPVNSLARSNQATHFIFDAGGVGDRREAVRGFEFLAHNDMHNVILSHGGACFIGDSGPALFIRNGDIFRYKRTPAAHNGVILNKTHSPQFGEYRLPESFKRFEDGRVCLVSSTHKGYLAVDMEALVRRTVVIVDGDYMLVMDDVFNGRKKPSYFDIDVIFHSPPDITIESAATVNHKQLLVYNSRSSEAKVINLTHSVQKVSSFVYRASTVPFAGWHSDAPAQVNESVSVMHSARFAKLPVRIYNLFYFVKPGDSLSALLKKIRLNLNKVTASIEISHRDYKDSIKINEKFEVDFKRMTVKV